ncbi:universal stress protein family protein [Sarocladium implicatum]|nr:universal stress protein family protein [Sarocladium implicatum]
MDTHQTVRSPDSDVSPSSKPNNPEYFAPGEADTLKNTVSKTTDSSDNNSEPKPGVSFGELHKPTEGIENKTLDSSVRRKSSVSSVTFRKPQNPSLPQGDHQVTGGSRLRASSPPHERFQQHVAFDNLPIGEATKNNMPSLTLNVRHKGYQARRRSRTFMVGVDENAYSDYALQWLLRELVDDGDEVICVRVLERESRLSDKQYVEDAQDIMRGIIAKNEGSRALSFTLEYAVGKLHATFQKLIHMYEPAMLIVGTRGRSLGGLQGLMNTRNSFSKYCLQYSPVPVVVVRPDEKRIKKKTKRANDLTRQTYVGMLQASHGKHEADSEASSTYELEVTNSPDEEAHQVAKVLGLPARFDPTIKPIAHSTLGRTRSPAPSNISSPEDTPEAVRITKGPASNVGDSDEGESEDDEAEFEVMSGENILDQQHKAEQLHKMEVGEAAALKMRVDDSSDDDEDSTSPTVVKTAS